MGINKMNIDKRNLERARKKKDDEFYSPRELVYDELPYYDFKDKIILCPFDDYIWSEFVKYFKDNFNELGIKKLIATSRANKKYEYDGVNEIVTDIDGDFFSEDVKKIIETSDVIVSNPPFSINKDIYIYK